ncbi:MAG: ABC transporter permease [Alistipes sp.]|nr:ABC transporter permease [Alistipes sp.]
MPKSLNLIWKLLRKHISIFELAVFFIANLIGMTVILGGVQLYSDLKPIMTGENALIGSDYLVITHPVERMGVGGKSFSGEDITELEAQEFVSSVGTFNSSEFEVYGAIEFGGRKLSTMLFFEAVPDSFLDIQPKEWNYKVGDSIIPIILPRNYLNLYNFGFSSTQQLPQITEDIIKRVELDIILRGNQLRGDFKGRVVGFSDRINTILVPMAFMEWANKFYGEASDEEATRLIIEVENPSDPELITFLDAKNYEVENKPSESSKAMFILKVCIVIIICIGIIFSVLSIIILTLSIYLLLQKNITKLENLILIGYKPQRVALPYNLLTLTLNISILALSIAFIAVAQKLYMGYISQLAGYTLASSPIVAIGVGVVFTIAIILFNFYIINRKIREISRKR